MEDVRSAETRFYEGYSWCLNPALPIEELLCRYREELDRFPVRTGWQREESRINLYLFVCAIACTADDYFAQHLLNLGPIANRFPMFKSSLNVVQAAVDLPQWVAKLRERAAWRWRIQWDEVVARACELLLSEAACVYRTLHELSTPLLSAQLPEALLKRHMRLPEAFRGQDMAHQDVVELIRRFCVATAPSDEPILLVGLRTAGAYFAPLMAEYLKRQGWPQAPWISIRPKDGIARWEQRQLRKAARRNARVLVIDDYPATGRTLRITLQLLRDLAIRPEQMSVLAPTHCAQPDWIRLAGIDERIHVFTIGNSELHKHALLSPDRAEELCRTYFALDGWTQTRIVDDDRLNAVNAELSHHSRDGHHVREKRAYALKLSASQKTASKNILFKSVGWGWLGYHAYLIGTRLADFVPPVVGLRNGFIITEWIESSTAPEVPATDAMVEMLGAYIGARCRRLPLSGDCRFESRTYRWTGTDEIMRILRSVYGRYLNRLKMPALRNELFKYVAARPTLIDGKIEPEEWIRARDHVYKIDFEHHNFGGAEPDLVDPAYDLAAAIFEFALTSEAEEKLLQLYEQKSADRTIDERMLIHKILYGSRVMRHSMEKAASGKDRQKNNTRFLRARDFLIYSMTDFCARLVDAAPPVAWSDLLFFMDVDGVFDQELLGFPHATQSALQALSLLRSYGYSVVLNTGRSVQHVRRYCNAYGLPGGIAEFGAVFVDNVRGCETRLIDSTGAHELGQCREAIQKLPGVFIDNDYEYSIRAYRCRDRQMVGLQADELRSLLKTSGYAHLTYLCRGPDSYIVQRRTGKARALQFVRREAGVTPVTAIGDSKYDVGMLKAAEFAYAPANCSPAVRELAKEGHCRIMKQPFQNGLLEAVRHRLQQCGEPFSEEMPHLPFDSAHLNTLMQGVLKAADRQALWQMLFVLSWWTL